MPKQKSAKRPTTKPAQTKAAHPAPAKSNKPNTAGLIDKPVEVTPAPAKTAPTHDAIAAKAYEIWLEKGRPIGQDDANWAEAVEALS